jgi:hypothetical protein
LTKKADLKKLMLGLNTIFGNGLLRNSCGPLFSDAANEEEKKFAAAIWERALAGFTDGQMKRVLNYLAFEGNSKYAPNLADVIALFKRFKADDERKREFQAQIERRDVPQVVYESSHEDFIKNIIDFKKTGIGCGIPKMLIRNRAKHFGLDEKQLLAECGLN